MLRLKEYNPPAWKAEVSIPYGQLGRPSEQKMAKFERFIGRAWNLNLATEVDVGWGAREALVWVHVQAEPPAAGGAALSLAKRWASAAEIATEAELDASMSILRGPQRI